MARFTGQGVTISQDSAANAVNTITLNAPGSSGFYGIMSFGVDIGGAATANVVNVVLRSASRVMWKRVIASAAAIGTSIQVPFSIDGVASDAAAAVTLTVDAGGAGCVTTANLAYYVA